MTIFFNYTELIKLSNKGLICPIKSLGLICGVYKPRTKLESILVDDNKKIMNKTSFLIHPNRLVVSTSNIDYKLQYLALASYRDYTLYRLYKDASLPISFFPEFDIDKLKTNNTLIISDTSIKFKYEE